jgi:uncharacterized membrane protein (DUF485 family)
MDHGPATEWQTEKSQDFNARLGIVMFAVFTPIYLAFILIAVISPTTMGKDVGSLNVAIVYGFGLIILAILQAIIYNAICSNREKQDDVIDTKGEDK